MVEHENRIYLVGGVSGDYQKTIQTIDFGNVENLQDAKARHWTFMSPLKHTVNRPALIYSNEKLLVAGYQYYPEKEHLQFLNLATGATGVYEYTALQDSEYPGLFSVAGGIVSRFGGKHGSACSQQFTTSNDLSSEWQCMAIGESTLENTDDMIRFSNFVL